MKQDKEPKINSHIHGHLIFDKRVLVIQWGKNSLFKNGAGTAEYSHA